MHLVLSWVNRLYVQETDPPRLKDGEGNEAERFSVP